MIRFEDIVKKKKEKNKGKKIGAKRWHLKNIAIQFNENETKKTKQNKKKGKTRKKEKRNERRKRDEFIDFPFKHIYTMILEYINLH